VSRRVLVGNRRAAPMLPSPGRRQWLAAAGSGLCWLVASRPAVAVSIATLLDVERRWANGVAITEGRVTLAVAPLVENGNTVPITVRVDSAMTEADHVTEIIVFNEKNPQRDVARFTLSPANGRAQVSTRIRLATSQQLVALARLRDGSLWSQHVDVIVTLAACIES
jgi:sulfur-oxidizing protein SoxY